MYSKRLCKGYRIIDDYSKKAYGREIAERLEMHLNYYEDPFQYENIRTEYKCVLEKNKEIDFDEILNEENDWMCKLEVSHEMLEEVITEYCNAIFSSGGELKDEE